jgi:release factor glutamine methyltransferase
VQLRESLAAAMVRLALAHVPSPRLNAELLLMFTLSCDRAYLFAHPERELTPDERTRYESSLAKRGHGIPAQYITGHQEFWGMDLIVSPAVLIPRPETEHVVEAVLELLGTRLPASGSRLPDQPAQTNAQPHSSDDKPREPAAGSRQPALRIVDIGTGSGAIALALAKEFTQAEIHATDISTPALEIARANAARHQLANRIHFHQTDLLAGLNPPFDFIVSNPPYVGESEEDQVQLEVRKFEPRNAVFAGATGLEVIERLIPQARAALKPEGWLVMEISGTIADRVRELLKDWNEVEIKPDLQSIPRVALARKP